MKWALRPLVRGLGTASAKALHTCPGLGECYYVSPRGAEPGARGRRLHHHLALPQRSTVQASGAAELLTTPSPYLDPAVPSEPLSSLFEPLSSLRRKQKIRGLTSAPGLAQETGGPSGPAAFSVPHSRAQFRPSAQRVTGGQATRVGRGWGGGAGLGDVSMSYANRETSPSTGRGAANPEPRVQPRQPPAETDKDPGTGGAGRVPRLQEPPWPKPVGTHLGTGGGAAEPGGAEVVVRWSVPGSAADHRPGSIAGAGLGARRTLGLTALSREALSLQPPPPDSLHKLERSNS